MKEAPPGGKVYEQGGKQICIMDPEFRDLLTPLDKKEKAQLEANLEADGRVLDPIVVWQEEMILLDGHNRLPIAIEKDLNFQMVRKNFETREQAMAWVIAHQLGKRNLSAAGKQKATALRRKRVKEALKAGKSERVIAKEEQVSKATIHRDVASVGSVEPTAQIVGTDGKKYQSRAERLGLNIPPKAPVIKGGREPGDGRLEEEQKKAAKTAPKPGKPLFDWKPFETTFAKLMLFPDVLGKAYKAENSPQAKALRKGLVEWKNLFKTWYKAISKQKAPREPSE